MSNSAPTLVHEPRQVHDVTSEPLVVAYQRVFNTAPTMAGTAHMSGAVSIDTLTKVLEAAGVCSDNLTAHQPVRISQVMSNVRGIDQDLYHNIHTVKSYQTADELRNLRPNRQARVEMFDHDTVITDVGVGAVAPSAEHLVEEFNLLAVTFDGCTDHQAILVSSPRPYAYPSSDPAAQDRFITTTITYAGSNLDRHNRITDAITSIMASNKPDTSSAISFIVTEGSGLSLMSYPITPPEYVDGTECKAEVDRLTSIIDTQVSARQRGLILFHGAPGTGKTSMIRHLVQALPERRFVVMTMDVFAKVGSPQFLQFMISECRDAVLVIEDADQLLMKRDRGDTDIGISALLNLGDGLLADVLCAPVICTFNMDEKMIDPAALRSSRLVLKHEFAPLSPSDVKKILDDAGVEYTGLIGTGVSVSDVYQAISNLKTQNQVDEAHKLLTKMAPTSFGFASKRKE